MNQSKAILAHFRAGGTLTHLDALRKFGCARLGARVFELRSAGHNIATRMITTGRRTRVAQYYLESPNAKSQ